MAHLSSSLTKSSYRRGSLLLALPFLLFSSACDSGGPQACEDALPSVDAGTFAVQVRNGGDCQLYRGTALFNPSVDNPDSFGRAFFVELRADGGENAPVIFLSHPGTELSVNTYEVSDLSSVNRFETREGKVSVGGTNVAAGLDALSIGEGEVEVEISEADRVVASFEATVKLKDNVDLEDGPPTVRLRGRLKADLDDRINYTIF